MRRELTPKEVIYNEDFTKGIVKKNPMVMSIKGFLRKLMKH